jgi:hypothetical protein
MFLRGWAGYFRYGHSARRLSTIRQYAWMRLALFISKKHRRSRRFGRQVMLGAFPRGLSLISLYRITVAPGPESPLSWHAVQGLAGSGHPTGGSAGLRGPVRAGPCSACRSAQPS